LIAVVERRQRESRTATAAQDRAAVFRGTLNVLMREVNEKRTRAYREIRNNIRKTPSKGNEIYAMVTSQLREVRI
jgi:hypothetical protein